MATSEEALLAILQADANLTAVIGTRSYALRLPESATFPCITFEKVVAERVESMEGSSGLCFSRFQINCFAKTYGVAKNVHELARLALQGYKATIAGVIVHGVNWTQEIDFYEEDAEVYRVTGECIVHHNEDKPS